MEKARSRIIARSGYLFILTNFLLAIINFVVGLLAHSLAITSDAVHSLIDSASGFIIVIGEKLSSYHKLAKNRATIERFTTVLIAMIIVAVGIHIIIESIEKTLEPDTVDYSAPTIIVLIISIMLKYFLARYLKNTGRRIKSDVLLASGAETLNDTWISIAVLISALVYLIWQIDIEAYLSLGIAAIIIEIGLEFIFPHISKHHHHPLEQDHDHGAKAHHDRA